MLSEKNKQELKRLISAHVDAMHDMGVGEGLNCLSTDEEHRRHALALSTGAELNFFIKNGI